MSAHYLNPSRSADPWSLPNVSIMWLLSDEAPCYECDEEECDHRTADLAGYYWSICFPGCLPDSDWSGPFETEEEALANARDLHEIETDDEGAE